MRLCTFHFWLILSPKVQSFENPSFLWKYQVSLFTFVNSRFLLLLLQVHSKMPWLLRPVNSRGGIGGAPHQIIQHSLRPSPQLSPLLIFDHWECSLPSANLALQSIESLIKKKRLNLFYHDFKMCSKKESMYGIYSYINVVWMTEKGNSQTCSQLLSHLPPNFPPLCFALL